MSGADYKLRIRKKKMSLLENIKTPSDLKKLSIKELPAVAEEIRERIVSVCEDNGGHLASSLGAVDAIVALYYVFDFPKDKIIFDVGHQSYAHKILSGRNELFDTIRKECGLSGFPNIFESEYDAFTVGHAGTSLSAALGYCTARDKLKEDYYVVSFVGDGSFFNGENLEALFSSEKKPEKLLIILNDNGMSISKNSNGLYKMLTKMSMKKRYPKFMSFMNKLFGWNFLGRWLKRIKAAFKRSLDSYGMLDTVGVKYVGAFDGHNVKLLVRLFSDFKSSPRATLLHIKTQKGKGYFPAEKSSEFYHGVSAHLSCSDNTFSKKVANLAVELVKSNEKAVFLTAGMALGTGLDALKENFPDRLLDVGISEEFCVTYAAGLAIAGLRPFVCIYSTFLQRAYDQIIEDVCLQNLPVIFLIDRAGVVGSDGCTHQGVFDISFLSHIPNMTVIAPKDARELELAVNYALKLSSPVAIRYPNGKVEDIGEIMPFEAELWNKEKSGDGAVVFAVGARMLKIALEAADGTNAEVVNARTVKPLDENYLKSISLRRIITLEENSLIGGFGSLVAEFYVKNGIAPKITSLGIADKFIDHASVASQLEKNSLTKSKIRELIEE